MIVISGSSHRGISCCTQRTIAYREGGGRDLRGALPAPGEAGASGTAAAEWRVGKHGGWLAAAFLPSQHLRTSPRSACDDDIAIVRQRTAWLPSIAATAYTAL